MQSPRKRDGEERVTDEPQETFRLIRFHFDGGRSGDLHGLFVLDDQEFSEWKLLMDTKHEVRFGEVLGKHSEVCGPIEHGDFTIVTTDEDFCRKFRELDCETGYNPFDYLEDDEEWYEIVREHFGEDDDKP